VTRGCHRHRSRIAARSFAGILHLLGLPPTADEIEAFEKDTNPKAWELLLDKLLASPQ